VSLRVSSVYADLLDKARWSHAHGRSVSHIESTDIDAARLFSYGYRIQTIGAFHATRAVIEAVETDRAVPDLELCLRQARTLLLYAEAKAMDPVPDDVRAVICTLYFYDFWVNETVCLLETAYARRADSKLESILRHFIDNLEPVTNSNGMYVTSDIDLPPQGSFRVPKLEIFIRPIIYGDHHSWNAAHLAADQFGVSVHRHRRGAEIHLGFREVEGERLLDRSSASVREGYAMPIPPESEHGFHNTSGRDHIVPFIFGSKQLGGWGVFFDVEPAAGDTPRCQKPLDRPR
jgi:hypothetical protein